MARSLLLSVGNTLLDLDDYAHTGIIVSKVDLGAPTVREVATELPTQDGVDDQTAYLGQRQVTIAGSIVAGAAGSRSKVLDLLAPFLAPAARPTLTYALDNDVPLKTLGLRASQWTAIPNSDSDHTFQLQFKADPIALGLTTNEIDVAPFSNTAGRTYPRAYPLVYPAAAGGAGTINVTTAGTYPAWPVFRIYGPATNPAIAIIDPATGATIANIPFTAINVTSGTYLEVNTKARTVLLNGSAGASRYSSLDFGNLTWAPLKAGLNQVRFTASSASSPAVAAIRWQDAYLF